MPKIVLFGQTFNLLLFRSEIECRAELGRTLYGLFVAAARELLSGRKPLPITFRLSMRREHTDQQFVLEIEWPEPTPAESAFVLPDMREERER